MQQIRLSARTRPSIVRYRAFPARRRWGRACSNPVAKRENMLLHQTTRLDTAGMIVVALRGRSCAMAKEAGGDADVVGIVDRNAGSGAIPEQVRVDRPAEAIAGPGGDPHINLV